MADTRTIWIQACIDAIRTHWTDLPLAGRPDGPGMRIAIEVLERMLTAEPAEDSGITVDG